jgi:predicted RNase H-like HicB family nuclease
MILRVLVKRGDDGYYVANCPSLKSCWSQGKSRGEALKNIREAITLFLEPWPTRARNLKGSGFSARGAVKVFNRSAKRHKNVQRRGGPRSDLGDRKDNPNPLSC